jgi:chemotaxis protein CheX
MTIAILKLPAILDLTQAQALRSDLIAALVGGNEVAIDASDVQRVSSPCLQVLAAAAKGGAALRFDAMSDVFAGAVSCLALNGVLGLGAAHV